HLVPAGPLDGGQDELRADIAFGKAPLVHAFSRPPPRSRSSLLLFRRRLLARIQRFQALILLDRHDDDDGAPMLGDSNRIGASQVDQSPEAVLRVFRAQGLHATPRYSRRSYWPIWPKTQWIPDSGGFPKKESSRWRRAALRPPA